MTNAEYSALWTEAVETYGLDNQLTMLMEEAGELVQAVNKYRRSGDLALLIEELADVANMSAQIIHSLGLESAVEAERDSKARRLSYRIAQELGLSRALPEESASSAAVVAEPPPTAGEGDVWQEVAESLQGWGVSEQGLAPARARREHGLREYGTPLQRNNGRDPWVDLGQELLDATAYLAQATSADHPMVVTLYAWALACLGLPPALPPPKGAILHEDGTYNREHHDFFVDVVDSIRKQAART